MAKSLFWSSDEAWKSLSPHLKRGQPGKPRVDDPTVISGFLHVLKTGCRWRDVPPMGYRQQSLVTAPCPAAHLREDGGRWPHSRRAFNRQQPRQSPSLGEWLKEGEFEEATSRSLGGRTSKISCFGRRSRQTGRFRADARKRGRRRHDRSASRPSQNQTACWRTRPTTPTVCAAWLTQRKTGTVPPRPPSGPHTNLIAPPRSAETSSNASSAS